MAYTFRRIPDARLRAALIWLIAVAQSDLTDGDSLALTETAQITAALPGSDSGALTESTAIAVALSDSDSATLSDTGTTNTPIADTDSASLSESAALAASIPGADSAALTETAIVALAQSDSATASEASYPVAAALSQTDSATLTDNGNVSGPVSNHLISVGDGYTDSSPKQIVRTSGGRLYTIAPNCDSYPDFSANGLTQTIRVNRADQTGLPSTFTRKDLTHEPAAVVGCAAAIDGSDNIHIVWEARNSGNKDDCKYLRYAVFDTSTDTWGAVTDLETALGYDDLGQGHENIAIALDANGKPHVVYLKNDGTRVRVYYTNKTSGSWSAGVIVDDQSFGSNEKCWHPNLAFDSAGRILAVWESGTFNHTDTGTVYARVRATNGTWGTTVNVSGTNAAHTCIDQSLSLLITSDGRWHLTFTSATDEYIQYRYSDDQNASWSSNNPGSGTALTHDPTLAVWGNRIRVFGHGATGIDLTYFEGNGGSGAWGTRATYATGNYDSSSNTRWSQFFFNNPSTLDVAFWNSNYPNVLYVGVDLGSDNTSSDSASLGELAVIASPLAQSDSASVSESAVLSSPLTQSDSASVNEVSALTAVIPSADSASVTESASIVASIAASDAATLSESVSLDAGDSKFASDSAALTEAAGTSAVLASSDSGTLTESANIAQAQMDSAVATEAAAIVAALIAALDAGTLIESESLNTGEVIVGTDGATLNESAVVFAGIAATDSITVSELVALFSSDLSYAPRLVGVQGRRVRGVSTAQVKGQT